MESDETTYCGINIIAYSVRRTDLSDSPQLILRGDLYHGRSEILHVRVPFLELANRGGIDNHEGGNDKGQQSGSRECHFAVWTMLR